VDFMYYSKSESVNLQSVLLSHQADSASSWSITTDDFSTLVHLANAGVRFIQETPKKSSMLSSSVPLRVNHEGSTSESGINKAFSDAVRSYTIGKMIHSNRDIASTLGEFPISDLEIAAVRQVIFRIETR